MSGLEEFEASESWRTNFKKFLFVERKPVMKKTVTINETHRYSLDIGKDLMNLLEERKKRAELEKPTVIQNVIDKSKKEKDPEMSYLIPTPTDTNYGRVKQDVDGFDKVSDESFEVLEKMCEKTASDTNSTLFRYLQCDDGSIQCHGESPWRKTSDESFEALERMCDKTASDPNSTLFQYLHSDHKEQVLAEAKKRSTDGGVGTCTETDFDSRDPLLSKFSDCTLLDDVEAPSRIWENTIAVDSGFRTSPIKMVGIMRPSTIIEEAADESANSDISSQVSFQTATTKEVHSDISSAYDTAHNSTATSAQTNSSNQRRVEVEIDVDEMLMLALEKTRNNLLSSQEAGILPFAEADYTEMGIGYEMQSNSDDADNSVDLIDLEKTLDPTHISPSSSHSAMLGEGTIVDLVVIDDDGQIEIIETDDTDRDEEDISVIDILSDEEEDKFKNPDDIQLKQETRDPRSTGELLDEENKENNTFETSSSERSMKFNDTMEEVEYLLKKGMEYMAAREHAAETKPEYNTEHSSRKEDTDQPNFLMATKTIERVSSDSPSKAKLPSSSTFIKTPSKNIEPSSNRYGLDMRPFPKLDIFGRPPQATIGHPRHKELTNKQFAHIVSPIGTYMKKTATTPLISTCKMKNKNANLLKSMASRELEYESRLCQPDFGENSDLHTLPSLGLAAIPGLSGAHKRLPKKAYISSELKHIVDERTPITIPGGKKIQKYLENAMMPAVLRHDGKMKIPGGINISPGHVPEHFKKMPLKMTNANTTSGTRATSHNNASLADLSVMSGDVSMYTIMDAQKF